MEAMIELAQVSRRFGPILALDEVDITVNRGEVMGFLGPNGAGKTTAMRILSGLLAPTSGKVRVAGVDVLTHPEEARSHIGFLPETPPLYPEMTVREYLAYLAALRGVARSRLKQAVEQALERCGLTQVAHRLLANLSKGYQQRAGIAQAIVHTPPVVILDEPTVGLDPIQIREIRQLIRELKDNHSVLLSTHILPEVRMTCSRVALIHQGKIVANDTLAGLESRAAQAGESILKLSLNHPPTAEQLLAIPGVARVEERKGEWWLTQQPNQDPIPQLLARAVAEGWDLRQMTPASHSLEDIFVQLTTQEEIREPPGTINHEGDSNATPQTASPDHLQALSPAHLQTRPIQPAKSGQESPS
ncbi:MAG: ABC transporter ATP-binding protein [Magnetococcales bacterium]|nr:ABC transporter ATP-binding protein [Magnetococcales bacterium]